MKTLPPLICHQSEIKSFLRCRRSWKLSANMEGARGLEPVQRSSPLWIGTIAHKALEQYYTPGRPETFDLVAAANDAIVTWQAEHAEEIEDWPSELQAFFETDVAIVTGILGNYDEWARGVDDFDVVAPEQEFSLPLRAPDGETLWVGGVDAHGDAYRRGVLIQGKLDAVVRDRRMQRLWFLEHKTFKSFDPRRMLTDFQLSVYSWAGRRIFGEDLLGGLYNVLHKKAPIVPPVVYAGTKREQISRASKTLGLTTEAIYRDAVLRAGFDLADYQDELGVLRAQGMSPFYERHTVVRNTAEIDEIGVRLHAIVDEMIPLLSLRENHPRIYPAAPDLFCPSCSFLDPCLAMNQRLDWKGLLNDPDLYRRRESTDHIVREEIPA